jgi:AbrB family looped-hinge helix DNA binding protein
MLAAPSPAIALYFLLSMYNCGDHREAAVAQTISSKGWVVIPADLRKKYGLKPGDAVNVIDYGGVLALVPVLREPIRQTQGLFAGLGPLTKELVEEHRREVETEAGDGPEHTDLRPR